MSRHGSRGFSLVEALVAATILAGALGALAQVAVAAARANDSARGATTAVMAARQKLEELRALDGAHPLLRLTPPGALRTRVAGCFDLLTADGRAATIDDAVFERRWSIEPLADSPGGARLLQVRVFRRAAMGLPAGVRLAAVKLEVVR
jgi:type II secretory pathway pseudopilin PulG